LGDDEGRHPHQRFQVLSNIASLFAFRLSLKRFDPRFDGVSRFGCQLSNVKIQGMIIQPHVINARLSRPEPKPPVAASLNRFRPALVQNLIADLAALNSC
jgi:hypothetical protein